MTILTTFSNLGALVAAVFSILWILQLRTLEQTKQLTVLRWLLIGLNGALFATCFFGFFAALARPYMDASIASIGWPLVAAAFSFISAKVLRILDLRLYEDDKLLHSSAQQLQDERESLWRVIDAIPGPVSWISFDFQYMGMNRFLRDLLNIKSEVKGQQLKVGFSNKNNPFETFVREFFSTPDDYAQKQMKLNIRGVENTYTMIARKFKNGDEAIFIGVDSRTFEDLETIRKSA